MSAEPSDAVARPTARIVAWALMGAGALYFAGRVGLLESGIGQAAVGAAALAALLHLTRTVDPAWILSGAIASTIFSGHWQDLGINASVGPNRLLLVAGALAVLLRAPPARYRPPIYLSREHLALAAALGYAVVSAIHSDAIGDSYSQFALLDQFGLLPFVMFLVAPVAFATQRQRMILLGTIVGVGAYLSVTAVLEKLHLYDLLVPGYIGDPGVGLHFGRARGPFADAAANGLALFTCAVAAGVALMLWRRPLYRFVAGAVLVLAPVGVLLSVTRGIWLASIVAVLVTVATTAGLRRFSVPIVAAAVLAVLGAFAFIPGLGRDARNRQADKIPIYERQNTNAAGLRMVADRPFFGFGWRPDPDALDPYFRLHPDIPLVGAGAGLHNIYLSYGVALGLVGTGLWLLALTMVFGRALAVRAPPELVPWQVGLKATLVAWLVVGLFSPAHYPFTTTVVWAWAGIVWPARTGVLIRVPRPLPGGGLAARTAQLEPR